VVFYGYAPALAVWMMKLYGHADARILDCDRATWRDQGRPWTTDPTEVPASDYVLGRPDPALRATLDDVRAAIDQPDHTILDVHGQRIHRRTVLALRRHGIRRPRRPHPVRRPHTTRRPVPRRRIATPPGRTPPPVRRHPEVPVA
jgi:hypothetical protein